MQPSQMGVFRKSGCQTKNIKKGECKMSIIIPIWVTILGLMAIALVVIAAGVLAFIYFKRRQH